MMFVWEIEKIQQSLAFCPSLPLCFKVGRSGIWNWSAGFWVSRGPPLLFELLLDLIWSPEAQMSNVYMSCSIIYL